MHGPKIAEAYINTLKYQIFPIRQILGWSTGELRCDCNDETCPNLGKHPRIPWSKEVGVPSMWEKWPNDGFGVATGKRSGIWVLDVDPRSGGIETLAALEQKHAPLPKTVSVLTGSKGLHFYFQYPGPDYRNTAGALGAGLDTRGDGGYIVGPGSLHKSGRRYYWQNGPADNELAVAPDWLLKLVHQPAKRPPPGSLGVGGAGSLPQGLHTSGTSELEAKLLLEHMLSDQCPLVNWMRNWPEEVNRETWRGVATNLACAALDHPALLEKAREAFHEISKGYSKYRPSETDSVFRDSVQVAATYGPVSYEHMVKSGMPADYAIPVEAKNLLRYAKLKMIEKARKKQEPVV